MKIYETEVERVTTRYGRLYVVRDDSVIGRSLKIYGEWAEDEISSCASFLSDGDTIIDVGANIGTHSIALASRFPHSEVVAFEPQPLAFSLLAANVLAARAENVTPRNLGCAETERLVHVAPDYAAIDWNVGGFSLREAKESQAGTIPLSLIALDGIAFKRRVQFIKIDVEGMEEAVLAGASKLISQDRPLIYFELLDIQRLAPLQDRLTDLGYDLRWLQADAFNQRNFRMNPENVWRFGETGVLAFPEPNPKAERLVPVTGNEEQVPVREYKEA